MPLDFKSFTHIEGIRLHAHVAINIANEIFKLPTKNGDNFGSNCGQGRELEGAVRLGAY